MPALDGLTGIVLGSILGSVFLITCIISAIKAVRDRSRIKKRLAVREKEKLENGYVDEKKDCNIEDIIPTFQYDSRACQPSCSGNNRLSNGTTCSSGSVEHLDLSVYSIDAGVDNLTFQHSNTNIQYAEENQRISSQKIIAAVETVPSCKSLVQKRAKSHNHDYLGERNLDLLSIEKIMRRHSYEIAVCDHSWLPQELLCDSPTHSILDAFKSEENMENSKQALTVAFENKAYETNDNKNT